MKMLDLVLGFVAFGVVLVLFKFCLPQGGKVRWFVGTQWEPYIAVGITLALVVSLGLAGMGLIDLVL
jgi:hypothetical protein